MKDVVLEQHSNTFVVKDHRWQFTETRLAYIAQKIRHTISVFKGEWFMDSTIGIPYIPGEEVEKYMHRRMIETALQIRIGEVAGVEKFLSFSSNFDTTTRMLTVAFTVQLDSGEPYSDAVELGGY